MAWATVDQVADWLGLPVDQRMDDALAAALESATHVRPDLDPDGNVGADVNLAVVKWAAIMYRSRTTPAGFSTFDQFAADSADYGSAIYEIRQLLGSRKPVAR